MDTAGTFTQVDFPGALQTAVTDMNAAGDMVGVWFDSTTSHGFIDKGGVFTSLDFPGATETQAAGINAADEVVGLYVDASSVEHGFILNGGVYTQLDPPQSTSTIAFGVNDAGNDLGVLRGREQQPARVSIFRRDLQPSGCGGGKRDTIDPHPEQGSVCRLLYGSVK